MKTFITCLAVSSLVAAGAAQAQQNRNSQPSGNPLSSIFSCQTAGNKQGQGAVIGGIIGGVVGNQLADDKKDRTLSTVLGAAVGAAAGSYIGCSMGADDGRRAQAATQTALQQGRNQTWSNSQSGASGRIDIVDTYNYGKGGGAAPAPAPFNINNVRWSQGVERPRDYKPVEGVFRATGNVVIRSGPSARSPQLGSLRNGDTVDGLVRVSGTDWLLAGRGGVALGYVSESALQEVRKPAPAKPVYDPRGGQTCRVFDQTYTPRNGAAQTQRYTACQTVAGDWVVQA